MGTSGRKRADYAAHGGITPAHGRFQRIQQSTQCIYSPQSRLWGCPEWDVSDGFDSNLHRILPDFALFLDLAHEFALDGYILELRGNGYGSTLAELARSTRLVLQWLSDRDPAGDHCMHQEVEDPAWAFSYGGEKLFVNSFAPCYPQSHSRYSFGCDHTYVFFQPRHSFRKAFHEHETAISAETRAVIRRAFERHGRPYDTTISAAPFDAYRFVRPLNPGDPPVRWWKSF
jgi:hypothetical protein